MAIRNGNVASAGKVGVGIIGVGKMGRIHADNIATRVPDARLVAVSDLVESAAREVASKHSVENVFIDYLRLIENREVQAVVVCVPTSQKLQIVKAALERGKHVFCEKPIALTLHDADQVLRASQKTPAKFQPGYQRRFDPVHVKLKAIVDKGEVGEVVLVRSNTRDPLPDPAKWPDLKASGGIFLDTCTHDYDVVRWLSGAEVNRVMAEGSPRSLLDQHTVISNLGLANGALAQVDASRMATYGYDVRVEVVGTKGQVSTRLGTADDPRVVTGPTEANGLTGWYPERFKEAYELELASFIDSIVKDTEPKVTARDGRAAVEVAVAAKKSMQEGKAVNLPM